MKPTYEQLEKELAATKEQLTTTQEVLKLALGKIAELEEKLNLNSKNSSKPPSSDQKSNTPDTAQKKKRKKRKGIARAQIPPDRIDRYIECACKNCPHCGSDSLQIQDHFFEVLQQIELPEVKAIVTEYVRRKYNCLGCGKNSIASLPDGIPNSSFGPKLMSLFVTLTGVFHLAKREAIQLIKDMYDIDISLGSASNIEERVARALDPVISRIRKFMIEGKFCKHFDETSWRDSGKRHYVWLMTSKYASLFQIDPSRSREAFERLIGKAKVDFPAVTDRYAAYNIIGSLHQYCLAHLIRDFRRYAERDGPDSEVGKSIETDLIKVCHIHSLYRKGEITIKQRNRRIGSCKKKIKISLEDGVANGSDKLFRLSEKLLNEFDKLWNFTKIFDMEPTNNLAERDLRKLVIWRKKSYGTRSCRGKQFVEVIASISETLKKQGENILKYIQKAISAFYTKDLDPPYMCFEIGF